MNKEINFKATEPFKKNISFLTSEDYPRYIWTAYGDLNDEKERRNNKLILFTDNNHEFIVAKYYKGGCHAAFVGNDQIIVVAYSARNMAECLKRAEAFANQYLSITYMKEYEEFCVFNEMKKTTHKQMKMLEHFDINPIMHDNRIDAARVIKACLFEEKLYTVYNSIFKDWEKNNHIPVFPISED